MDNARRLAGRACMVAATSRVCRCIFEIAEQVRWVSRWRAGLPVLLAVAFWLSPARASTVPVVEEASTGDRSLRCSVVLGPEAPDLEVFAAHELVRYLRELYGIRSELVRSLEAGSGLKILLGNPQTNPAFQSISTHHAWPEVSDQGIVLKRVNSGGRELLILGGGSPAATLWAVYELVERSGVRFLLEKDVFPEVAEPFPPRRLDLVREPRFRFRSYRAINNLATSLIFYGMKDYRHLIDQLAKMKFNVLYAQIYPHQPFVHYQMREQPKTTGVLHYGWRVPIHAETIGRELFEGRNQLVNPELAGATTYRDRVRAAQGLLHELFAYARRRGMQTGLNFRINQFTNEFNWKLPQWSDRKYIPEEAMKGARNARLGISEYAVDPQAFPYMTPENPAVMELNKTIIRAHVNTYPEADFYGLTQPELPGGGEQFREMWERLDRKFQLEPEFSLDRMLESARANTLPVGVRKGDRPVEELKGALANADTLDKLLNEGGILKETANPGATVVVSTFSDEFYPVMPRIFPGRVMLMVPMDYLTSLAAERTEMLAFAEHSPMKVAILATLADDNIGILPQLPTQPLHRIFQAMERYKVSGYFGRQFLVTKLEAGTAYMAQASWSSGVTPESVYRDQVRQVCGEAAVSDMLEVYRILEEATLTGDRVAMGFLFPVTTMMRKHWNSDSGPNPGWEELRAHYLKASPLVESALEKSRPQGKSYLRQLLGQLHFGTDYIAAVQEVRRARLSYLRSRKALAGKDAPAYEKAMNETNGRLEKSLALLKSAIQHWAGAVRDPSDLGALGALNTFCYDYLKGVALDVYLESGTWSIRF